MTTVIGSFFPERDQPPLSADEADVIRRFHQIYYDRWLRGGAKRFAGYAKNLL